MLDGRPRARARTPAVRVRWRCAVRRWRVRCPCARRCGPARSVLRGVLGPRAVAVARRTDKESAPGHRTPSKSGHGGAGSGRLHYDDDRNAATVPSARLSLSYASRCRDLDAGPRPIRHRSTREGFSPPFSATTVNTLFRPVSTTTPHSFSWTRQHACYRGIGLRLVCEDPRVFRKRRPYLLDFSKSIRSGRCRRKNDIRP